MRYFELEAVIETQAYYGHILPDYLLSREHAAGERAEVNYAGGEHAGSIPDDGKILAEVVNSSPAPGRGVSCLLVGSRRSKLTIAAAIDDPARGISGPVCSWLCRGLDLQRDEIRMARTEEITGGGFLSLLEQAVEAGLCGESTVRSLRDLAPETGSGIREFVVPDIEADPSGLEKKLEGELDDMMADGSLRAEVGRILSPENRLEFLGHPVHYRVRARSCGGAAAICRLLIKSLYARGRLQSRRSLLVSADLLLAKQGWEGLEEALSDIRGGSCVILAGGGSGRERKERMQALQAWQDLIARHHWDVLFFAADPERPDREQADLFRWMGGWLEMIPVKEGSGSRAQAIRALKKRLPADRHHLAEELLPHLDRYTVTDLIEAAGRSRQRWLVRDAYPAYDGAGAGRERSRTEGHAPGTAGEHAPKTEAEHGLKTGAEAHTARQELGRLIGLDQVKETMEDLLVAGSMARRRMEAGLPFVRPAMHMVFSGNPGTAKTTTARLAARLLFEQGMLESPKLVECGRSQLVGEYVGWTAKMVRDRFEEASGGVLLIDEAYSLAEDSGRFGQEAIDAIVQEMENRRENTAVIFTGYPEKMDRFLDQNEGLRSRIPFHIHFPDYSQEEMEAILTRMAEDRGYRLTPAARKEASSIIASARKAKDFGNGRFARNLLEQAVLCQGRRLEDAAKAGREPGLKELMTVRKEDLLRAGDRLLQAAAEEKKLIGFQVRAREAGPGSREAAPDSRGRSA